jgi:hypothetical protein
MFQLLSTAANVSTAVHSCKCFKNLLPLCKCLKKARNHSKDITRGNSSDKISTIRFFSSASCKTRFRKRKIIFARCLLSPGTIATCARLLVNSIAALTFESGHIFGASSPVFFFFFSSYSACDIAAAAAAAAAAKTLQTTTSYPTNIRSAFVHSSANMCASQATLCRRLGSRGVTCDSRAGERDG